MANDITWQNKTFAQLNTNELYDLLKLRVDTFIVEQMCIYSELDDHDRHSQTRHLLFYQNAVMVAYLRILPEGITYKNHISLGRVVVARHVRGTGLGHELIKVALSQCLECFSNDSVKISAQEHLEKYYNQHGFERASEMYLEDGIPHISMLKAH